MLTDGVWAEIQLGNEHLRLFSEHSAQGVQASVAFCARCGASLSGNPPFCLSCATPVMSAVTSALPRAAVAVREPESADTGSNLAAALAYLGGFISGIIVLNFERYKQSPFVRFHAFQSIFLNVSGIVVMIALGSISGMLGSGFLWSLIALVKSLLGLAFFMLAPLFMMYKAYKGERLALPFVGPLAAKRAG